MKLKIVLCEGAHDIGFISKILLANDYKIYDKKIKDFPKPLNEYIKKKMSKDQVGDKKLGFSANYSIPFASYTDKDSLILFHNMGGDKTTEERCRLMDEYIDIIDGIKDRTIYTNSEIEDVDFYMFFDSDDLGIEGRLEVVRTIFSEKYGIPREKIRHGEKTDEGKVSFGVYVFHDRKDPEKKGTLEDQIISLFTENNKDIVDKANIYLTNNELGIDRTKEYYVDKDTYKGSSKFDKKKSLISVAGQLQFSGMNNSVIIAKSDYITKQNIFDDVECQMIMNLLKQ